MDLIDLVEDEAARSELKATQQRLMDAYDKLSNKYHTEKVENGNNSLVLG